MDSAPVSRTALPAWQALQRHAEAIESVHMRELFDSDPQRFARFSLTLDDLLLDYSKNRITDETREQLLALAGQCELPAWIERMFSGEAINHTEQRAVLHTALRDPESGPLMVEGEDVLPQVQAVLAQMRELSNAIRSRQWRGYTGQPITDVVNIGVGGSDLGPVMACEALRPYAIHDLRMHFVSNVDENHILDTLEAIKPETTLFIIVSKSFTTQDTLVNAKTARKWFRRIAGDECAIDRHFIAVSDNVPAAVEFGIPESNIFRMWDWVGGRYSMWSAVGLSIAISVGMDHFEALLQGACDMDRHFRSAPLEQNMPVILGLLGIWYNNFLGAQTYAVLPYDQHLKYLPDYLRQMDMESNGKSVDRDGNPITDYETGPVLFGQLGITGQHAFYQLMHQGTKLIPADIIAPITSLHCIRDHHRTLMSNVFAQTEAFMRGKTEAEARADMQAQGLDEVEIERLLPYRLFPGNKPTNTILFRTLDPRTLGRLIALYEHKVFVQGVIWNINSFDQWGVELGKQLAAKILPELEDSALIDSHDASTNGLINYYKGLRP
ncbi:MAG: glucose-6-phosphate isomerase, partial [Thiohalophilus sp.]|uniref:glucose-6-phosphate isomerase n=1 Tax=Thiohalophilus sp. TaxID=3028392 RepID=UPI0028706907